MHTTADLPAKGCAFFSENIFACVGLINDDSSSYYVSPDDTGGKPFGQ